MRVFLLDLWLDLREKRLAPVALLLLAAIVAVPLVLAQDKEDPPPAQTDTTAQALPAGAAVIEGAPEDEALESRLQTFSPRDPFAPTEIAAGAGSGGGDSGAGTTSPGEDAGSTGTGTGTVGGGDPGGGVTGSEPGSGGGTTGGGTGGTTGETRTRVFTYTVDVRFGRTDAMRMRRGVRRLELLPNENDPKLVFLGVTTTGKTAVFLVSSNLGVETDEGRCRPSPDECTFLYLRPDSDHDQARFTDENGETYAIRLLDIDRITVSSSDGGSETDSGSEDRSGSGDRAPAFTGSTRDQDSVPGDTPPGEPSQPFTYKGFFGDEGQ